MVHRTDGLKSDFIPNSFQLPDAYSDLVMPWLTGEEWKVLSYLCRRIFGFRKQSDRVSLSQLKDGIRTSSGKVLDFGTQLSRQTIINALGELIKYKLVTVLNPGDAATQLAAEYSLNLDMDSADLQGLADRKRKKKVSDTSRTSKARASLSDRLGVAGLSDRPPLVCPTDNTWSVGQTDKLTVNIQTQDTDSGAKAPAEEDEGANNKNRGGIPEKPDILDGILEYAGKAPAIDAGDYPEDIKRVIIAFCESWNIKPPTKDGKRGGEFALWISDGRYLREALGEFGTGLLPEVKKEWDKAPFVTGRPGAIIKITRHVAGLRRGRSGGLKNSEDKPLSIQERKEKFRNSGSISHGNH